MRENERERMREREREREMKFHKFYIHIFASTNYFHARFDENQFAGGAA